MEYQRKILERKPLLEMFLFLKKSKVHGKEKGFILSHTDVR